MKNAYKSFWLLVVSILFSSLLLVGCDSKPDYEQKIKNYMMGKLKDPDSAQYRFQAVSKGEIDNHEADIYFVYINAKNSFGAYAGYKEYIFAIYKKTTELSPLIDANNGVEEISKLIATDRFEATEDIKVIDPTTRTEM